MLIDTHAAVRNLENAGMDTALTEAVVNAIAHADERVAAKRDLDAGLESVKTELRWIRWTLGFLAALVPAMAGRLFGVL